MLTIPYDMTASHVPVLAGELIEALDPQPGQIAIDCTFGAGGHARLVAERIGPVRHADRHRPRPGRRAALRRARRRGLPAPRASCTRRSPTACASCCDEGVRADLVYVDLGISSMQVDTWERGFSYSYDAPLDMRMDPEQELDAADDRQHLGRAPHRPDPARVRRRALRRRRSPARIVRARADEADRRRPTRSSTSSTDAIPARARFAGGHPAKRTFQAIRIAVNDELGQIDEALPLAWERPARERPICRDFLPQRRRPPREALPRRPRAGLHLPAGAAGVRVRSRRRRPS